MPVSLHTSKSIYQLHSQQIDIPVSQPTCKSTYQYINLSVSHTTESTYQ